MACGCKNKNKSNNVVSSYKMRNLTTSTTTNKEKTKAQIREELLKRMRDGMA